MNIRMSEAEYFRFKKDINRVYPRSQIKPSEFFQVEKYPIYCVEIEEELYNYINTH